MLLRSIGIFILITTLSGIFAADKLNLDDVKTIKKYFDTIANKAVSDYQLDSPLNDVENKRVLNLIFEDKQRVFDELANISMNLRYNNYKTEWMILMRSISKNEFHEGMFGSYDLHSFEDELDALHRRIELSIDAFKSLGQLNDDDNVKYFCTKGYPIANLFLKQLLDESVHQSYLHIIGIVKGKMESFTDTQEINRDRCGQSVSFRKALYDYYQLFMLVHIKFVAFKFYNSVMSNRCLNTPYRYDWVGNEVANTQRMMNYTKKIFNEINHYIYTCEPLDYERQYENIDIELRKMMRPVMINEENISTSEDCNHRCDIDVINNAHIHQKECKEYRDCKYVSENTTIYNVGAQEKLNKYLLEDVTRTYYSNNDSMYENEKFLHAEYQISNYSCGFCLCTCVSKPLKSSQIITALSFRDQVVDINKNMVVGAIQFIEKDYMIHIQIMETELMPSGDIDLAQWKSLEHFDYDEATEKYYIIDGESVTPLTLGVDYGHPDIMNLDDVIAPPGYLITGMRFRFAGDSFENPQIMSGPIQLQIRVTPFNFTQGKLIDLDKTHWIAPDSQNQRNELVLDNPDNPSKISSNPPDSKKNEFIRFRTSDWCKNSGVTTVPFLNGQTIRFIPMIALGGVGIYHRGRKGYGGYLAFRLFDMNLSKLLHSNL